MNHGIGIPNMICSRNLLTHDRKKLGHDDLLSRLFSLFRQSNFFFFLFRNLSSTFLPQACVREKILYNFYILKALFPWKLPLREIIFSTLLSAGDLVQD